MGVVTLPFESSTGAKPGDIDTTGACNEVPCLLKLAGGDVDGAAWVLTLGNRSDGSSQKSSSSHCADIGVIEY